MKSVYFALFCLSWPACIQAAQPVIRTSVAGLTQTSKPTGEGESRKEKGVTVEIMCTAENGSGAFANEEVWADERKEQDCDITARDSSGADLGKVMLMPHPDKRGVTDTTFFSLRTERLPAGKVEWIELLGSIPCKMLDKPSMSKPHTFDCKQGTSWSIDDLSFELGDCDDSGFSILLGAEKKVPPFELVFTNARGEQVAPEYRVTQQMVIDDSFAFVRVYKWSGKEERLTLSIRYWKDDVSVRIPVTLKARLVN